MTGLPDIMAKEMASCVRLDCRVREACGRETGCQIVDSARQFECLTCEQMWKVLFDGGYFMFWDKDGTPHYSPSTVTVTAKWLKGEAEVRSRHGCWEQKLEDVPMRTGFVA